MSERRIGALLRDVKAAGEDYEWYPTTSAMVSAIARRMDKHPRRGASRVSILDIGAGDGRVLAQLAEHFARIDAPAPELFAIEKSTVLVQAQPENVVPVGTELFEQNLTCLPVDYLISNPPYSEFETWAAMIIETGHARAAFLIIPQRWKDSVQIADALARRGATWRVIHSDDFLDAPRRARAVIDIVEITFPRKDRHFEELEDPFDRWFDANISTFDSTEAEAEAEAAARDRTDYELREEGLAKIRHLSTIEDLVSAYNEEYARMEENYRAIFKLDYQLLKELGVSKDNVRDGIKKKMAGLKNRYWTALFERLGAITNRLSTATKKRLQAQLMERVTVACTASNAYAVTLWAIKNANQYFDEQTVALYKELSTFDGVLNYKSNQRTWQKGDWRWFRGAEDGGPTHYALDYRIVVDRYHGIFSGENTFGSYEFPHNLYKACHELLADIVAVLFNLGFPSSGPSSIAREWRSGEWQNWHRLGERGVILFQCKAHMKGSLHFRFLPEAIRAINVEAGRLLGWLKSAEDVVEELGYAPEEAATLYGCTRSILPAKAQLLLGNGVDSGA